MNGFYSSLPSRRSGLRRGKGRLGASARTVANRASRAEIVALVIVDAHGRCARCGALASEGHEPASRGRYPGSHLNLGLVVASCRPCNWWASNGDPRAAEAEGWLLPSGLSIERAVELTARWKRRVA